MEFLGRVEGMTIQAGSTKTNSGPNAGPRAIHDRRQQLEPTFYPIGHFALRCAARGDFFPTFDHSGLSVGKGKGMGEGGKRGKGNKASKGRQKRNNKNEGDMHMDYPWTLNNTKWRKWDGQLATTPEEVTARAFRTRAAPQSLVFVASESGNGLRPFALGQSSIFRKNGASNPCSPAWGFSANGAAWVNRLSFTNNFNPN